MRDSLPVLGLAAVVGGGLLGVMWSSRRKRRTVVITGGCGNLGVKLATHLLATPDPPRVVLIEHPDFYNASRVPAGAEIVLGDLIDGAGEWTTALQGADALVHFSAVNPYPNANWAESAGSMLHTFNAFVAAKRLGVRRVVFASSNHVRARGITCGLCPPQPAQQPADTQRSECRSHLVWADHGPVQGQARHRERAARREAHVAAELRDSPE